MRVRSRSFVRSVGAIAAVAALAIPVLATGATVNVTAKGITKPEVDRVVIKGKVSSPSRDCRAALVGIAQFKRLDSNSIYKTVKPEADGTFKRGFDHPAGKKRTYIVYAPNAGAKPGCPQDEFQLEVTNVD